MKINNKGSSKGKGWSFFGKALLWSTALIFVSCGFNKKQETNSNLGDFVDFINLGISVEEKKQPTFGLAGGFSLAAGSLLCGNIDYHWGDSASGYNPTIETTTDLPIGKVKFIDLDVFTLKVTKFYCTEGSDTETIIPYAVVGTPSYLDGEVREYSSSGRNHIEVTQTGDCVTAGKGGRPQVGGLDVAGCDFNSTIAFSLTSFNLEAGSSAVAAASFQSEVSLSFSDGEPIPALTLSAVKYLNDTYVPLTGRTELGQVWECDQADPSIVATGDNDECSGQLMKNLNIVLIDDSSKAIGDALMEDNDISGGDPTELAAIKAALREAELIAAIRYEHELVSPNNIAQALATGFGANYAIEHGGASDYKGGNLIRHGLEAQSSSNDTFYSNLRKYVCIYSVGVDDDNALILDWAKLGAKCRAIVFAPVEATQVGF